MTSVNHFLSGELCLRRAETTHSARQDSYCEPVKASVTDNNPAPVSRISAELRRIRTARRRGAHATARRRLDRLIDYVWFSGPETDE